MINELLMNGLKLSAIGSVMMVLLLVIRKITGTKAGAWWRSLLWLLILCRICIPIIPTSSISFTSFLDNRPVVTAADERELSFGQETYRNMIQPIIRTRGVAAPASNDGLASIDWMRIIAMLYMAGLSLFLGSLIYNAYHIYKKNSCLELCADKSIQALFTSTRKRLLVKDSVRLYIAETGETPYLTGLISPRVVMPTKFIHMMTMEQLELVMIHELTHYKRKDILKLWFLELAVCIHFFNPVLLYARRIIQQDIELACDEKVLRALNNQQYISYAEVLTLSSLKVVQYNKYVLTAHIAGRRGERLKERLQMIKNYNRVLTRIIGLSVILIMAIVLVSCTTIADEKEEELQISDTIIENDSGEMTEKPVITENTEANVADENEIRQYQSAIEEELAKDIVANKDSYRFIYDLEQLEIVPHSTLYYLDDDIIMHEEFSEVVEKLIVYPIKDTDTALTIRSQYGEVHHIEITEYHGQVKPLQDSDYYLTTNVVEGFPKLLDEETLDQFLEQPISTFYEAYDLVDSSVVIEDGAMTIYFNVFEINDGYRGCYLYEKNDLITSIVVNDDAAIALDQLTELFIVREGVIEIVSHMDYSSYENAVTSSMKGYYNMDIQPVITKDMISDMGAYDWIFIEPDMTFKIDKTSLEVFYMTFYPEVMPLEVLLSSEEGLMRLNQFISSSELLASKGLEVVKVKEEFYFDSEEVEYLVYELATADELYFFKLETQTGSVVEIIKGTL